MVGVGEYENSEWDAPVTRDEAQAVVTALRDPYTAAYRPENVHSLYGSQATRAAILNGLKQIAAKSDRQATILLYFCGHGEFTTDGSYAFAPHDAIFRDDDRIERSSGITSHELQLLVREIPARKVVCVINTCFAGHVLGSRLRKRLPRFDLEETAIESDTTGEGLVVLTAGRATQASYYRARHPYTLFGQAFIDGLRGEGVPNYEGYVDLFDLYRMIHRRVTSAAEAIYCEQEPTITIVGGVGHCPIACYPHRVESAAEGSPLVEINHSYRRSRPLASRQRLMNQCTLLRSESQSSRARRPLALANVSV